MQKGDILADIFDSPDTIAQARREGYSLVDPADIEKLGDDLEVLTKPELLELARQKGIVEKSLAMRKKSEIIDLIKAAGQGTENPPETPKSPEGGKEPENPEPEKEPDTPKTEGAGGEAPANGNTSGAQEAAKEKHGFFGGKK
jgi:hypothetical protein